MAAARLWEGRESPSNTRKRADSGEGLALRAEPVAARAGDRTAGHSAWATSLPFTSEPLLGEPTRQEHSAPLRSTCDMIQASQKPGK